MCVNRSEASETRLYKSGTSELLQGGHLTGFLPYRAESRLNALINVKPTQSPSS